MRTLSINVNHDDLAAIQEVVSRFPLASRHAVARAAFRAGLDQMVRDRDYALDRLVAEHEARKNA